MGGKTTTSTNKVTIPQDVLDRYNAVNAQAQQVAQNPFQKYGTKPEDFVAQFNEQQLKGVQGINAVAGMGPVYENVDKYMSPYIKNVADTTRAQMEQANEQAQSGALGTAVQSGAFGGDRAGVAAANLANQQNLAMGSTMANIYNQGYTQAVDTSMNDMNRMLGVAGQQLGVGTQMQQTEQAGKDALINQFMQEQGYPFQVAQFLANIAMGTGALSGSTTTTTQMAPFSDRRLKHDIKKIGEADNGLPIYTFKYKGDENHQTHVGFMADEVEKKNPDAVGLDPSGYKTVDYDKAAQSMGGGVHARHSGEGFADGGVAGPYGSKVGQGVGMESYVPQAYLPVGELMVADPAALAQHESAMDTLNSMAGLGKSVMEIRDSFRKKARGGVVDGYAGGGGVQPPLHGDYLSSTLAAQEKDKEKPELMTAKQSEQPKSGFENVVSGLRAIASIASLIPSDRRLKHDIKRIGKTENGLPIYTFKYKGDDRQQTHIGFMADEVEKDHPSAVGERNGYKTVDYSQAHKFADGGVAGYRHGYALDGAVEDRMRDAIRKAAGLDAGMRLTRDEVPAAQTLGSLPDARVMAAEAPTGVVAAPPVPKAEEESARAYRRAAANRFNAEPTGVVPVGTPVEGQVRPAPRPNGLGSAVAPENIGIRPEPRPKALEDMATGYDAAREHFNTRVIPVESFGGKQFDPKTGKPLTSKAGAVGIAQVMESTGPEAADLAGLPWDRDRWLHDEEYNKALGEAYYLSLYRRFGSLDKADAAYNAGPTFVQNALDASGGDMTAFINSLPAETQEYLKKTGSMPADLSGGVDGGVAGGSGGGSGGVAGGTGSDTLGSTAGGLKPYEERNWLGKIMHNKDGTMNKDAMLSLLAGLGDMFSSPSPFFLRALASGLSGAAKTYMAREEQVADIENKKLDAMKKVSDETIRYNNRYKTNYTTAEYEALALDINTPPPDTSRVSDVATYAGVPVDPFGAYLNELIATGNGTFIRAADSLQYNERLLAAQQNLLASGAIDPQTVANTEAQIEEIKARNGVVPVLNADGSQKVDANGIPVYTTDSTVSRIEQARVAQVEGDKLKATVGDRISANQTASTAVDKMVDTIVAAGDQQGILAPIREIVSGVAQELGLGTGEFRALQNEMEKSRASFISANGELTDMARNITGSSLPSLSNEAAANAYVAATMQAYYEREAKVLEAIKNSSSPQDAYNANIDEYAKFDMKAATEKYYKENIERLNSAIVVPSNSEPVTVTTQEEYNALPLGTPYIDSQGNRGVRQ